MPSDRSWSCAAWTRHGRLHRLRRLFGYVRRLADAGGRLYLSGVDPAVLRQIRRNRTVEQVDGVRIFAATDVVGESSLEGHHAAQRWLTTPG